MPISSQFEEVPSERLTPSASDPNFAQTSLLTGILLLESDLATLSDLTGDDCRYLVSPRSVVLLLNTPQTS